MWEVISGTRGVDAGVPLEHRHPPSLLTHQLGLQALEILIPLLPKIWPAAGDENDTASGYHSAFGKLIEDRVVRAAGGDIHAGSLAAIRAQGEAVDARGIGVLSGGSAG